MFYFCPLLILALIGRGVQRAALGPGHPRVPGPRAPRAGPPPGHLPPRTGGPAGRCRGAQASKTGAAGAAARGGERRRGRGGAGAGGGRGRGGAGGRGAVGQLDAVETLLELKANPDAMASDIYSRSWRLAARNILNICSSCRLAVINVYFDMVGWLGLHYEPLTMLWSVQQGFFPEEITSLDLF